MKKIIDRRPYICYSWKNSKLNLKEGKHSIMAVFIELFLLGVGLSMDAFAVSVCKGLGMRKLNKKQPVFLQAVLCLSHTAFVLFPQHLFYLQSGRIPGIIIQFIQHLLQINSICNLYITVFFDDKFREPIF